MFYRDGVRSARIGKQKDAEFEAGLLRGQFRVREFPLALLLLKQCFDGVGVRCFAGPLAVTGQFGKVYGFGTGSLGDCEFVVGRGESKIKTGYGRYEPAARDFQLGRSQGSGGIGAPEVRYLRQAEVLVEHTLAGIFMDSVIGNKYRRGLRACSLARLGRKTIGLGVEILVVKGGARQQAGSRNGAI